MDHNFRKRRKKMKRDGGFSLIELLIAVVIFGMIIIGIAMTTNKSLTLMIESDQERFAHQNAWVILDEVASELRHAGYIYGNSAASPAIKTAEANQIVFYAVVRDADRDGKVSTVTWASNGDSEMITFRVDNGRIRRDSTNGISPIWLSDSQVEVVSLNFKYHDQSGTIMPTPVAINPENIRMIGMVVNVRKEKTTMSLETEVRPRNLL